MPPETSTAFHEILESQLFAFAYVSPDLCTHDSTSLGAYFTVITVENERGRPSVRPAEAPLRDQTGAMAYARSAAIRRARGADTLRPACPRCPRCRPAPVCAAKRVAAPLTQEAARRDK